MTIFAKSGQNEEANESFDQNMTIFDDRSDTFEDILEDSDLNEKSEIEVITKYPNEAYADLMTLVTKYKLNNATGNEIIKFFNKHANLSTSSLPISIKKGRKYMDNMNIPSLTYDKTCVIKYNNKDYYLHHRSLINCVKHILSISDILEHFTQKFESLEVIISSLRFIPILFYIDLLYILFDTYKD
jgi:hypothetical protein